MSRGRAPKRCFGEYGCRFGPEDHDPKECFTCEFEKHCYQMTVADAVISTASDLNLLINSLMACGAINKDRQFKCPMAMKP